jgi:hypothetical protein
MQLTGSDGDDAMPQGDMNPTLLVPLSVYRE